MNTGTKFWAFYNEGLLICSKTSWKNAQNSKDWSQIQGRKWRVGRVGNCPPRFWCNRRRRRAAAARHHAPHYYLPTQCLVATYAPGQSKMDDVIDAYKIHSPKQENLMAANKFIFWIFQHTSLAAMFAERTELLRYSNCSIFEQANIYILMLC